MSGHPQGGHYEDGYGQPGQPGQDAYYHDDPQYAGQYTDQQGGQNHHAEQHGDAYYDESCVSSTARIN
jgi:1,3-beta-glucan synthase